MGSYLRDQLLRLAYRKPGLRASVLPILAEDTGIAIPGSSGTVHVSVGKETIRTSHRRKLDNKTGRGVVEAAKAAALALDTYTGALGAILPTIGLGIVVGGVDKVDAGAADLVCSKFGTAVIVKGLVQVTIPGSSRDPAIWKACLEAGKRTGFRVV